MRFRAVVFLCLTVFFCGICSNAAEPARPLTPRGLDNLVAFTRLLGYVRHFHPSDQAAAADWDALAVAGVREVEGAAGPAELAQALERVFQPVAPTVQVSLATRMPPLEAGFSQS